MSEAPSWTACAISNDQLDDGRVGVGPVRQRNLEIGLGLFDLNDGIVEPTLPPIKAARSSLEAAAARIGMPMTIDTSSRVRTLVGSAMARTTVPSLR